MSQTELQTLVMETLKRMQEESSRQFISLNRDLQTLEDRQTESEKHLRRLSELYKTLPPLIEAIENAVKNGPQ